MTTHPPQPVDAQAELMVGLLEGADPDAYVVIPVAALTRQVGIAIAETLDSNGRVRPGKTSVRLVRSLLTLGWIVDTAHPPKEPAQ